MIFQRSLSPASLLALAFAFSFTLYILYGQSHFYRDPGSAFYDPERAYEQQYSSERLQQIEHFRNAVKSHHSEVYVPDLAERPKPEICVTMTTFFRHDLERQYIEDAVLSMLDRITPQERSLLHLNLLFTDLNATVHPSWHKPWLRSMLDNIWSYDDDERTGANSELRSWLVNTTLQDVKIKATMDYTLALQKCLDHTDAPYIAAFEGDTLFAAGWVAPTLRALKSADEVTQQNGNSMWWGSNTSSSSARDWIFMRLFNQERSTGWSSRTIGSNHEVPTILIIDAVVTLLILLLRHRNLLSTRSIDNPTLLVLCLLIIPVSVITFFQSGKASLLPPRPGLRVENFGCCSQALVFNRAHVPGLISYLRDFANQEAEGREGHVNYDLRTRDFADDNGLDRLALYPMLVQHMGVQSALGTAQDEAKSVWSMAFESLRDKEVRARHDRAMDELFGTEWREEGSKG